ncbi:unnamed protein product [Ectocarpus sp. 12 AP-2014]
MRGNFFPHTSGELVREVREVSQSSWPLSCLRPEAARGLHPEQAQRRFDTWWDGVNEEMGDVLRSSKGSTGGEDVEHTASVASDEVARLER